MSLLESHVHMPPPGSFSFSDLKWVSVRDSQTRGSKENAVVQTVQIARVLCVRMQDFEGEGARGTCTFYIK